jgi:hypothetical protein
MYVLTLFLVSGTTIATQQGNCKIGGHWSPGRRLFQNGTKRIATDFSRYNNQLIVET